MKLALASFVFLLAGFSGYKSLDFIYARMNPVPNWTQKGSIDDCFLSSPHRVISLKSLGSDFSVRLIENASLDCANPNFPIIEITSGPDVNAWLQIVRTDSKNKKEKVFVDSCDEIFPFYTLQEKFIDAPHWGSSFFKKYLSKWVGHAYAINLDKTKKELKVIGGVEWGFRLPYFSFGPKALQPRGLSIDSWNIDKVEFKKHLLDYKILD